MSENKSRAKKSLRVINGAVSNGMVCQDEGINKTGMLEISIIDVGMSKNRFVIKE